MVPEDAKEMNSLFPLVSILVPTYNEEVYVADCLRSILAQDYPNFEVIVFDEILLQNMFSTSSNEQCLIISPLFWVLIVIGFVRTKLRKKNSLRKSFDSRRLHLFFNWFSQS
jgi:cellulose synthase/poly-beta-1,6-N-acetylglucosamine synthase-like glycosyltransferase